MGAKMLFKENVENTKPIWNQMLNLLKNFGVIYWRFLKEHQNKNLGEN